MLADKMCSVTFAYVVGFIHSVLGLAANTARGTGCWRQHTEADRPRCFDARSQARGLCLQPSPARPWLKPIISRSHLLYSHVSQRKSSRWTTFPSRNPPFSFACFWLFPSPPPEINFTKILPVWLYAGALLLISQQLNHSCCLHQIHSLVMKITQFKSLLRTIQQKMYKYSTTF